MLRVFEEKREFNGKENVVRVAAGLGNFTNEIETRTVQTANGDTTVGGGFGQSIAFNYWKDGKEQTKFYEIAVWGKRAEAMAKLNLKGARACVFGRLSTNEYTNKDGELIKTDIITIEDFTITNFKENNNGEKGIKKENKKEEAGESFDGFTPIEDFGDDDIPF